jgi:hypothetical protein
MNRRVRITVIVLATLVQAAAADPLPTGQSGPNGGFAATAGLPERVLQFPPEQAVGQISLIAESYVVPEVSREFHPGYVFTPSRYLGPARGAVRIPVGQRVCLHLGGPGVTRRQCLDVLQSLGPEDVQILDFLAPLQVDDEFLPYVARLTGLTHFCPVLAHFSADGWLSLRTLSHLEHICTPYGLTDAQMAVIAALPAVREMEIIAPRLTDAGLAALARLRNLQVLHLEGTAMMTDEGLQALATLPKLRHLRLSGPFTDRGLAYLSAAPALKALWLETPRATEDGLRSLAQIPSLERLTVPWLDLITHRSMVFLRSMPNLKALGVGNAANSDAGVVALATLTNLEVLALKGGPALTDDALRPLARMPRLRALEIYHSRITEAGLAGLSACPKLESVQIRSAIAVPAPAVARLKAAMPQLQTLEVYPLASQARSRPAPPTPALLMQ